MAILIFWFVSVFSTRLYVYGLQGRTVCLDFAGELICCSNYEEVNGECVECKQGSTSRDGGSCLPCKDNSYGIKCLQYCHCSNSQRCNPVIGCVTSAMSPEKSTPYFESAYTEPGLMHITVDTKYHRDHKILSKGWIFSFCIFGIVLLIAVLTLFWKFMLSKKHQIDGTKAHNKDNDTKKTIPPQLQEHDEHIETKHEYEEIDDNLLVDNPFPNQQQHTTVSIDICRNSSSDISDVGSDGSYLNPCETPENEFEDRKSSDASNDSSFNERDNSAYLNPYQPLQQSSERKGHDYEPNTIVHRAVDKSCKIEAIHSMHNLDTC